MRPLTAIVAPTRRASDAAIRDLGLDAEFTYFAPPFTSIAGRLFERIVVCGAAVAEEMLARGNAADSAEVLAYLDWIRFTVMSRRLKDAEVIIL